MLNHRFSQNRPLLAFRKAFTLVEMLTVVGIIALLVVLVTPTLVDVLRSTRISSAGDALINRLSTAQQEAIARSKEVEFRFYKYINPDSDNPSLDLFYAYQIVLPGTATVDSVALSEAYYMDSGVVISDNPDLSLLLQTTVPQTVNPVSQNYLFEPASGVGGGSVNYAALRFYPEGGCRLLTSDSAGTNAVATAMAYTVPPLQNAYLTLIETRLVNNTPIPPPNYYCIQLDAFTGKARVYRP